MKIYHQVHPEDFSNYKTAAIREKFLMENLVSPDKVECAYTHYDRMVIGAAYPVTTVLKLESYEQLKADYFLVRREIGILNIAGDGTIVVDGEIFALQKMDCLYIGMGKQDIVFDSNDANSPAKFIFFSSTSFIIATPVIDFDTLAILNMFVTVTGSVFSSIPYPKPRE